MQVRVEIKKALLRHVLSVFGTVKMPKVAFWTEMMSDLLSPGYPFMFGQSEDTASKVPGLNYGRDLGGKLGKYILEESSCPHEKQIALIK